MPSNFGINITINPSRATRGAGKVDDALARLEARANRLQTLFARALAFTGIGVGLHQLVGFAEELQNLQNRLRTVVDGTDQLNVITDELFKSANRTNSSFIASAELYTRTALATRELGVSQRETLQFTESLNKAILLSGATAQEAAAGVIQLSQGLASGKLSGDELRSTLEQIPVVADVISKSLGITRGELRSLGKQGKLTPEVILKAFREARVELDQRFKKLIPTISQSFEVLRNRLIKYIGELNKSVRFTQLASTAINFLGENLDTLGRIAGAVGIIFAIKFAKIGVGAAIAAVKRLTVAIAANPLGALAVALTATIALLTTFSDKIQIGTKNQATFGDLAVATFHAISDAIYTTGYVLSTVFGPVADLIKSVFGDIDISISSSLKVVAKAIDFTVGAVKGAYIAFYKIFKNFPEVLEAAIVPVFDRIQKKIFGFLNDVIRNINSLAKAVGLPLIKEFEILEYRVSNSSKNVIKDITNTLTNSIKAQTTASDAVQSILDEADRRAAKRRAREIAEAKRRAELLRLLNELGKPAPIKADPGFEKLLSNLKQEEELLKLSNKERDIRKEIFRAENKLERALTETERQRFTQQLLTNQSLREENDILQEINGPIEDYTNSMDAVTRLLENGVIATEQFTNKIIDLRLELLESSTTIEAGIERGVLSIKKQFTDVATVAEDTIVGAFSKAEDAIVQFVNTGKLQFKDLVNSIAADITRLAVRQAIIAPLAGLFPGPSIGGGLFGGGGGIFGEVAPEAAFANGGSFSIGGYGGVDRNVLSLNDQPVARVSKGETVTVTPKDGGNQKPVNVIFNISTPDADSFKRSQDQILSRAGAAMNRAVRRNG